MSMASDCHFPQGPLYRVTATVASDDSARVEVSINTFREWNTRTHNTSPAEEAPSL